MMVEKARKKNLEYEKEKIFNACSSSVSRGEETEKDYEMKEGKKTFIRRPKGDCSVWQEATT